MTIRIGIAGFAHETNTFADKRTDLTAFVEHGLDRGEALDRHRGTNTVIGGALEAIAALGNAAVAVPIVATEATPGGLVTVEAFETVTAEIVAGLRQHGVDAVLLNLHGAMVTEQTADGEAEILRRVREVVGAQTPIVAVLDCHTHLTQEMVSLANVLLPYDTYPHVDTAARGAEAVELLNQIVNGTLVPVTAWRRLPLLTPSCVQCSELEPMWSILARTHELERQAEIVNTGIIPGFAYADVPIAGFALTVTTNGNAALAESTADDLASFVWERREQFRPDALPVEAAIHAAMLAEKGPVILADQGDNPGGGTPADGTALLWGLLDLGAGDAALGVLADPVAVDRAFSAGEGAELTLELGGKTDEWHGYPITVRATVSSRSDGQFTYQGPMHGGARGEMGRTAVLTCRGRHRNEVDVIVAERRIQALDVAIFRSQGIDPAAKRIVAVKSAVHFRGSFTPIAAQIINVDTPGLTAVNLSRFPYHRRPRPVWPLDDDVTW